jgi:hypothetical protein
MRPRILTAIAVASISLSLALGGILAWVIADPHQ